MKRKFCGFLLIVLLAGLLPASEPVSAVTLRDVGYGPVGSAVRPGWAGSAAGQQAGETAPGGPPAQGATAEQAPVATAPRLAAQADLLPPPTNYMLQEVIQVPANGSPVTSATTLAAGVGYQLRVSGTLVTGGNVAIAFLGDAEYVFSNIVAGVNNSCGAPGVDVGIGVNNTTNGPVKTPNWGAFQADHVYTTNFTGLGAPITLNYHDCDYSLNRGSLTVEILAQFTAPNGVPNLVDFEDLPVGTHVFNQYDSVTFLGGDHSNSDSTPTESIVQPAPGTASPSHALQSHILQSCEFCGTHMTLQFALPQHRVALSTGLAEAFNGTGGTLRLEGFAANPETVFAAPIAGATAACLGPNVTPVDFPLQVNDPLGRINYVRLETLSCDALDQPGQGGDNGTILLDNLVYDRELHPPAGEHVPPIVSIQQPANGSTVTGIFVGDTSLGVQAAVTETALYSMTAAISGGAPALMSFRQDAPDHYTAYADITAANGLISGTNTIVVRAWDFDRPQNVGSATSTFHFQVKQPPPATDVDIWPTAVEATQAIDQGPLRLEYAFPTLRGYELHLQDPLLVQGKPALVRVYGAVSGSTGPIANVPARAEVDTEVCTTNCVLARGLAPMASLTTANLAGLTLQPLNTPASSPGPLAANLANSWNFLLPADWTTQDLVMIIHVNDGTYDGFSTVPGVNECLSPISGRCGNNNEVKLHLHFAPAPQVGIVPVYIHVTGTYKGKTYNDVAPREAQVDAIFSQMDEIFPWQVLRDNRVDITVDPGINKDDLLDRVKDQYGWGFCGSHAQVGYLMFIGIFPSDQGDFAANEHQADGSFVAGYGTVGTPFCGTPGAWADANNPIDPAHELSHNIGFDHWGCENGVNGDECGVYPIPHGGLGGFGLDLGNWRVIPPGDTSSNSTPHAHDLMSYGQLCGLYGGGPGCDLGEWVSPYDYDILYHHPGTDSYDTDDPPALAVSGRISTTGAIAFQPVYRVSIALPFSDTIAEDDLPAIYTMQGYDALGNTLFVHNFEPAKINIHSPDYGKLLSFDEFVPDIPGLQHMTVAQGNAVLAVLADPAQGKGGPQVSITAPTTGTLWAAGSQQTIVWTANSPANLPLTALVEYSPDGGTTRMTLDRNLAGTSLAVDTDQLPGSTNAFIYVEVSDGFNTASAQAGPFTVAPKPPVVHIVAPETNSNVQGHVRLQLEGTAFDRQETLTDSEFHWSSSLDGALGTGRTLSVANLSMGVHTLTLTIQDSQGRTGQDSVVLTVTAGNGLYLPLLRRAQ